MGLIDVVSDCNGYTEATFGSASHPADYDTDQDGMPNTWETKYGLNPNDASDANLYNLDSRGFYTNIEVYCHSLVESIVTDQNKAATTKVDEYYPDMKNCENPPTGDSGNTGSGDNTGDVTITIDEEVLYYYEADMESGNSVTFSDGATATIPGNSGKSISSGKDITIDGKAYKSIKLSNGVENTFVAPSGKTPVQVTFYSYVNKDEGNASATNIWANVDGVAYTTDTTPLLKSFLDGENPDVVTFTLSGNKSSFTYKNSGTQLCYVMKVAYGSVSGSASGITNIVRDNNVSDAVYNLQGQRVPANYKGIVIKNGKKYINK